jgi:hypothetical protein
MKRIFEWVLDQLSRLSLALNRIRKKVPSTPPPTGSEPQKKKNEKPKKNIYPMW